MTATTRLSSTKVQALMGDNCNHQAKVGGIRSNAIQAGREEAGAPVIDDRCGVVGYPLPKNKSHFLFSHSDHFQIKFKTFSGRFLDVFSLFFRISINGQLLMLSIRGGPAFHAELRCNRPQQLMYSG